MPGPFDGMYDQGSKVDLVLVCHECRMLQEEGGTCRGCGGHALVPSHRAEALSSTKVNVAMVEDEPVKGVRDLLAAAATVVFAVGGMMLGFWLFSPLGEVAGEIGATVLFGAGAGLGWFGHKLHFRRVRKRLLFPIALPEPKPGSVTEGTATLLTPPVLAPVARREALAVSTTVFSPDGGRIFFRRADACSFLLRCTDGSDVLVCGEMWVDPPAGAASDRHPARRATRELLGVLGIPDVVPFAQPPVIDEWAIYPGQRVQASGEPRRELVGGGQYRDAERVVLRGAPGVPIILRAIVERQEPPAAVG